jgi:two-component system, LytTR family, sensor kinase
VPRFSIQSLVENAVKHNRDRLEPLTVAVVCQATGGGIMISVEDNGEGFPANPLPVGRGLTRLAEVLMLLYPDRGILRCGSSSEGGARTEFFVEGHVGT